MISTEPPTTTPCAVQNPLESLTKLGVRLNGRITRLALWWLRRNARDSNIVAHGLREMAAAGMREEDPEDGPNKWIARATHNLLAVFSDEGHSGGSAGYAVELFSKLARFQPWGPLTGEDSEWNHVHDDTWQNNRCSHVFKVADGAYDLDGIIGRYPDGSCVTSGRLGRDWITFPYTPTRRYVELDEDGEPLTQGLVGDSAVASPDSAGSDNP